jgi:hypothetical protein
MKLLSVVLYVQGSWHAVVSCPLCSRIMACCCKLSFMFKDHDMLLEAVLYVHGS